MNWTTVHTLALGRNFILQLLLQLFVALGRAFFYSEDVLVRIIFKHSETELDNFKTHMNNANRGIKFTHEKSLTTVTFLDVTIYKEKDYPILTHIKPTNKQLYVKWLTPSPGEWSLLRPWTNSNFTKTQITEKGIPHQPHQQTLKAVTFHNKKKWIFQNQQHTWQ